MIGFMFLLSTVPNICGFFYAKGLGDFESFADRHTYTMEHSSVLLQLTAIYCRFSVYRPEHDVKIIFG